MTEPRTNTGARKVSPSVHYTAEDRERLGRLEGDVTNLQAGFGDLRNEVRSGFTRLHDLVAKQADIAATGNKTNWGVVLTGIGTAITLAIAAASVTVMHVNNTVRPTELAIDYIGRDLSHLRSRDEMIQSNVELSIEAKINAFDVINQERSKTINSELSSLRERSLRNEALLGERSEFIAATRERLARIEEKLSISSAQ